jgi:hypothetical protein
VLTVTVSGIFHGHMNEPLGVSRSGWLNGLRAGVLGANDVVGALAILSVVGARLGGSPVTRAVMRIVIGGAAALATTFAIGSLLGTSGIPWPHGWGRPGGRPRPLPLADLKAGGSYLHYKLVAGRDHELLTIHDDCDRVCDSGS